MKMGRVCLCSARRYAYLYSILLEIRIVGFFFILEIETAAAQFDAGGLYGFPQLLTAIPDKETACNAMITVSRYASAVSGSADMRRKRGTGGERAELRRKQVAALLRRVDSCHLPEEPRVFRCSATESDSNFFFHVIQTQVTSCSGGRRLPASTYVDYGFWKGVFGWYL